MAGPDGKIWGMDGGWLFIYNPKSGEMEFCEKLFPKINYETRNDVWRDAFMEPGEDGSVYIVINNGFYKIDPHTKKVTAFRLENSLGLARDRVGAFYFINFDTAELVRFKP